MSTTLARRYDRYLSQRVLDEHKLRRSHVENIDEAAELCETGMIAAVKMLSTKLHESLEKPNDQIALAKAMYAGRELQDYCRIQLIILHELKKLGNTYTAEDVRLFAQSFCFAIEAEIDSVEVLERIRSRLFEFVDAQFNSDVIEGAIGGTDVTPQVKAMDDTVPMVA